MTYYEEFGVRRTASLEEIRQAYKALARLLHPDQCADEKLRALAETQMKRLNEMLGVLSDSDARRRYDAALDCQGAFPPPGSRPGTRGRARSPKTWLGLRPASLLWLSASAVALVVAFVFVVADAGERTAAPKRLRSAAQPPPEDKAAPAPAREPSPEARLAPPRPLAAESGDTHPEADPIGAQRHRSWPPPEVPPRPAADPAPAPRTEPAPATAPPTLHASAETKGAEHPAPSPPGYPGKWFYPAAARSSGSTGLYAPEYIELRLREDAGQLKGVYRARYSVPDQAISPEVEFGFSGEGRPPLARIPWTAAGGARGVIVLRLVSEKELQVDWKAFQLGGGISLTGGTARLVRQQPAE
jgi:curved DNA-binding protein CbpA